MLTSKLPMTLTSVPECVLAVRDRLPQMAVNLRPDQRPVEESAKSGFEALDSHAPYCYWMDKSVLEFILQLRKGMNVAMLFQDHGGRIGYMIVRIKSIYWSRDGGPNYPRLDFDWPSEAAKFFEAPNFWGSFILAIARVSPSFESFFLRDAFCENFLTCVKCQRLDEVR
ncbi:MAG: hypothetical protein WCW66_01220 [Patescibacteria group bacterium]